MLAFLWWILKISMVLVLPPSMPEMWIETSHHIACDAARLSDTPCRYITEMARLRRFVTQWYNPFNSNLFKKWFKEFFSCCSNTESIQHSLFSWFIMLVEKEWEERCRILCVHNKDKLHEAAVLWTETFIYGKSACAL